MTSRLQIVVMVDLSDIGIRLLNVVLRALTGYLQQLDKLILRWRWLVVAATRKTHTDRHQRTAPAHARENLEAAVEAEAHAMRQKAPGLGICLLRRTQKRKSNIGACRICVCSVLADPVPCREVTIRGDSKCLRYLDSRIGIGQRPLRGARIC